MKKRGPSLEEMGSGEGFVESVQSFLEEGRGA